MKTEEAYVQQKTAISLWWMKIEETHNYFRALIRGSLNGDFCFRLFSWRTWAQKMPNILFSSHHHQPIEVRISASHIQLLPSCANYHSTWLVDVLHYVCWDAVSSQEPVYGYRFHEYRITTQIWPTHFHFSLIILCAMSMILIWPISSFLIRSLREISSKPSPYYAELL